MKSRHKQLQNIKIGKKKCGLIIKRKGKQKSNNKKMNTNKKIMVKYPKQSSHNKHIKKPHEHNH
jgi:hypothetical protein